MNGTTGRVALAAIALAGASLAGASAVTAKPAAAASHGVDETTRNRATVTAFADLFYRQKKVRQAFERYVAADYIQHNPDFPDGREAPIAPLEKIFGPAAKLEVKRIIVDGDMAVIHIFGRLNEADRGLAVVDIYRLAGGRIVEHWDVIQPIPETPRNPHAMF